MDLQLFARSNRDLFSKPTRDGLLILSPDEKFIYILKGVGRFIWDRADGRRTVKEIIDSIAQEFDIDSNVAEKDIISFLNDAIQETPPLFIFSKTPA